MRHKDVQGGFDHLSQSWRFPGFRSHGGTPSYRPSDMVWYGLINLRIIPWCRTQEVKIRLPWKIPWKKHLLLEIFEQNQSSHQNSKKIKYFPLPIEFGGWKSRMPRAWFAAPTPFHLARWSGAEPSISLLNPQKPCRIDVFLRSLWYVAQCSSYSPDVPTFPILGLPPGIPYVLLPSGSTAWNEESFWMEPISRMNGEHQDLTRY